MRIHIGRISSALAENINELEKRLERFGPLASPILLHRKQHGDFHYGYADIDVDEKQYRALSAALNGLTFKQSKLTIQPARPRYQEQLAEASKTPAPRYNPEQLKRIRHAPAREINVFHARVRASEVPREDITFRVMIKGKLHKPKPRKRKLWGVERRPLAKLVSQYVDGEWRDSEGKAVEVVSSLQDEHARDIRIAEELAAKSAYLSDSDFDEFQEQKASLEAANQSDDDIEIVPRSNAAQSVPRLELDYDSDDATSFKPQDVTGSGQPVAESLRSALTADRPFTLFGGPSEEQTFAEQAAATPALAAPLPSEPKVGLFFDHKESPYLRSQSQAAKLVTDFDAQGWETSFWENRGEWNRALRRRRKEAAKLARKTSRWR